MRGGSRRTRFKLRSYLMGFLVPLTVLPLLLLSGLTHFFVEKALDQEVQKRARPEISALGRHLDHLEKRLLRSTAQLVRREDIKQNLSRTELSPLRGSLNAWLQTSVFDSVRVYGIQGKLMVTSAKSAKAPLSPAWKELFASGQSPPNDRLPATKSRSGGAVSKSFAVPASRYGPRNSLVSNFRSFLARENFWVAQEVSAAEKAPSTFKLRVYRTIYDASFRPAGYLEGMVSLDAAKWRHLARFQGVDLVLVDKHRAVLAASDERLLAGLTAFLPSWAELDLASTLRFPSRTVETDELHVEFFFSPLRDELSETLAWVGVGIPRTEEVLLRQRILLWMVALTVLLALLVVFLTLALSDRITRPISDLVHAVESVRAGAPAPMIVADSTTELGYLADRFNEMAMSVQAAKRMLEAKLDELARSNIALTGMQDQLVQAAKMSSLGQLVAGVAHELNNPIAFIYSNMVQMRQYLKNIEKLDALVREARRSPDPAARVRIEALLKEIEWDYLRADMADIVQSCLEGSVRVKDIVIGLRNFSRLDKGELGESDLDLALKNTAKLLSSQIKNRVRIEWALSGEALVRCNASQISQVFMNIMANAVQAIEGEGRLWVSSEVVDREGRAFQKISIRDDGQGMPSEVLGRIFDPFFTTKAVGEGTGLGLSIVYGIIQKHEGHLEVRSLPFPSEGHGTVFEIYLPKDGPSVDTELDRAS